MARLSFDFMTTGVVTLSFDPEEFRGIDYADIKDAIRAQLPSTVDSIDIIRAAQAIALANREPSA